ncbi:MAG: restriction endonuclease [Sulfolobaceae archaeon]
MYSYKLIVMRGVPSSSVLKSIESLSQSDLKDFLWIFVSGDVLYVVTTTYKHNEHFDIISQLSKSYKVEFLGDVPIELKQLFKQTQTKEEVRTKLTIPAITSEGAGFGYRGKDILEDIVAMVLEELGFNIRIDYKIKSRAGTIIEVDVWGEKNIGDSYFYVYVTCKNLDKPVEVSTVREEFGRVMQMQVIPHVRFFVASRLTESARKEAISDGFIVIEVGKKATHENAKEVYEMLYNKLNDTFVNIAPTWLKELSNKILKIAEELKKISEDLSKLSQTSRHKKT